MKKPYLHLHHFAASLLLLLATVAISSAAETVLDIGGGKALLLDIEADKIVSARVLPLVRVGDIPPPDDDDDTPPPPQPPALTAKVRELAAQVQYTGVENHRKLLSDLYRSVATQVSEGTLPAASVWSTVSAATDLLLGQSAASWAGFRSAVSDELTSIATGGGLTTTADYVRVLSEISEGLK